MNMCKVIKCPKCGSEDKNIGIEYSGLYDGVLLWECLNCKTTWGRFSNIIGIKPDDEVKYKKDIPKHKFNGGLGATLCYSCNVVIKNGLHNILLCDNCKQ